MKTTFPILKIREIVKCLRELHISLSTEEIKKPTRKKMMEVYEKFLHHMMGVSKEELRQPAFDSMDCFEYPELHEDSVGEFSTSYFLLRLFHAVGLTRASMRDFMFPKSKRTIKTLSALINFAKFREEKLPLYTKFCTDTEELQNLLEKVAIENDSFKANLAQLKEQREQDAPQIEKLSQETEELAGKIEKLNELHASLRTDIRSRKTALKDTEDRISTSKFEILNVKEENNDLKEQLVQSPERVKKVLKDLTKTINVEKGELQESAEKARILQNKVALLQKVKNKLAKRIATLKEYGKIMKTIKELQRDIKDGRKTVGENKEHVKSTNITVDHMKRQISQYQTKLFELQEQFDEKRQAANKLLNEAMKKKMESMHIGAQEKAKIEHNTMVYKTRKHELELAKKTHSQKMQHWKDNYADLLKTVRRYHDHLRNKITAN